jgi:hypothetical protein
MHLPERFLYFTWIIFLITGFVVTGNTAFAQKQSLFFYGKVFDMETRKAIPDVNIHFTGTNLGISTNKKGEFSFFIDTIPVYMIISHLGYETQRIWLDNSYRSVNVMLKPASLMLKEVEIKAVNKPMPFFKDTKFSALDFEVDSSLLYLLVYRFRLGASELLCLSASGDTIARSGALRLKPAELFLDCFGNIHILSQDSVYQVVQDSSALRIVHTAGIKRFDETLRDCVASTQALLFFKKLSLDKQSVEFFSVNRKTRQRQYLTDATDEYKQKMLRLNPYDHYLLTRERIPEGREAFVDYWWIKKILYRPNTSSLHKVDEHLCVFNSVEHTLELFTLSGDLTAKLLIPTEEKSDSKWTTEIYIDRIEHKVYTSFLKGGRFTLFRVDLNTGDLKRILSAVHAFPDKVRVHDGFLFYLYDVPGIEDNKHIFRQKL